MQMSHLYPFDFIFIPVLFSNAIWLKWQNTHQLNEPTHVCVYFYKLVKNKSIKCIAWNVCVRHKLTGPLPAISTAPKLLRKPCSPQTQPAGIQYTTVLKNENKQYALKLHLNYFGLKTPNLVNVSSVHQGLIWFVHIVSSCDQKKNHTHTVCSLDSNKWHTKSSKNNVLSSSDWLCVTFVVALFLQCFRWMYGNINI